METARRSTVCTRVVSPANRTVLRIERKKSTAARPYQDLIARDHGRHENSTARRERPTYDSRIVG